MFVRDVATASKLNEFYENGYCNERQKLGQKVNATVNGNVFRRFIPSPESKSILDVGSGYGFFLDLLRDIGLSRRVGIELSNHERRYARTQFDHELYGNIIEMSDDDRFDVITLFEVIEHIPDPVAFIKALRHHLKPDGTIIIGTDNFASSVARKLGDRFPKWIPHEHISYFTPETLCSLITSHTDLELFGNISFTPWELYAHQMLYIVTMGRLGGIIYSNNEQMASSNRPYRNFALRLLFNKFWFNFMKDDNLEGEMMYIAAKAQK